MAGLGEEDNKQNLLKNPWLEGSGNSNTGIGMFWPYCFLDISGSEKSFDNIG